MIRVQNMSVQFIGDGGAGASEKRVCAGGSIPCAHPFFGNFLSMAEQLSYSQQKYSGKL